MIKINRDKVLNWEYWPSAMFYLPNIPYYIYLSIKARSLTYFSLTNPGIKSSGNGTESKYDTIQLLPNNVKPKSVLVKPNNEFTNTLALLKHHNINFPLIAKPDIGFRGLLVKKIKNKKELKAYLEKYIINIILQEYLDYENECGVFYYRNPNSLKGSISSLTLKHFLTITGDGSSTLRELITKDNRAKNYIELFETIHNEYFDTIISKGKTIKLTDIGNHAKGTQFINGNTLISEKLIKTFDKLSHQIDGWYYGRIDIKYNTFKELEEGSDFKILEINGIIAEPTHIYDASTYTYFEALKAIRKHWKIMFEIAIENKKTKGLKYQSFVSFTNDIKNLKKYTKKIKLLEPLE